MNPIDNHGRRAFLFHAGIAYSATAGAMPPDAEAGRMLPMSPTPLISPSWLDLRSFGAAGDGSRDDSDALQRAIDKAKADGGGMVWIPAGTYRIGRTIKLYSTVILKGQNTLSTTLDFRALPYAAPAISMTPSEKKACQYAQLADFSMTGNAAKKHSAIRVPQGLSCCHGVHERIRIESFHRGYDIAGEMWGMRLQGIEINQTVHPFEKYGQGSMTSLQIEWMKFYRCFHGFKLSNTTYSRISYYYEQCGLTAALDTAPAKEVPISFHAVNGCVNLDVMTGQEFSNAMVLYCSEYSTISFSCALVTSPKSLWTANADRAVNIPLRQQGLFSNNTSHLEIRNLSLILRNAKGYPAAEKTASCLLCRTSEGSDLARTSFKNCFIDVESYYFANPANAVEEIDKSNFLHCISREKGNKQDYVRTSYAGIPAPAASTHGMSQRQTMQVQGRGNELLIPVTLQNNGQGKMLLQISGIDGSASGMAVKPFEIHLAFSLNASRPGFTSWAHQGILSARLAAGMLSIRLNDEMENPVLSVSEVSTMPQDQQSSGQPVRWHGITLKHALIM